MEFQGKVAIEYMREKKLKVAFYCRVGNPADIGMAVRHIPNHDDSGETISFAGQQHKKRCAERSE